MARKGRQQSVFISYAADDTAVAEELAEVLAQAGVGSWLAAREEVGLGDQWAERIESELRNARTMVVLLTPVSVRSPSIFFEVGAAIADSKTIIPILLGGIKPENVPAVLRTYESVQALSPRDAADKIAMTIKAPA